MNNGQYHESFDNFDINLAQLNDNLTAHGRKDSQSTKRNKHSSNVG